MKCFKSIKSFMMQDSRDLSDFERTFSFTIQDTMHSLRSFNHASKEFLKAHHSNHQYQFIGFVAANRFNISSFSAIAGLQIKKL